MTISWNKCRTTKYANDHSTRDLQQTGRRRYPAATSTTPIDVTEFLNPTRSPAAECSWREAKAIAGRPASGPTTRVGSLRDGSRIFSRQLPGRIEFLYPTGGTGAPLRLSPPRTRRKHRRTLFLPQRNETKTILLWSRTHSAHSVSRTRLAHSGQ
jgi:hypothetical protein